MSVRNPLNLTLGDEVKDRVTGFRGIIVAKTEWLNGCFRVTVQPRKLNKDGCTLSSEAFDIEQVQLVKRGAVKTKPEEEQTGGPMPEPSRWSK